MRDIRNRVLLRLTLAIYGTALCVVCAGLAVSPALTDVSRIVAGGVCVGAKVAPGRDAACIPPLRHELTGEELDLLARVISAEARGESYEGQVAVGAVVLNRVAHEGFPDSVAEVCYQPGAFSSVADGQIDIPPGESCMRAAEDAALGADPTGGAVYFYNPDHTGENWIRSREVVAVIGEHCFCV